MGWLPFILTLFLFTHAVSRRPLEKSDGIDALFQKEFAKLKEAVKPDGFNLGALNFSTASPSHVDAANWTVIINKNEIENYLRGKNVDTILLIKYVLSHEVAHIFELFEWGIQSPSAIDISVTPFLECEADVIAGYLIKAVLHRVEIMRYLQLNPNRSYIDYELDFVHRIPHFYGEISSLQDFYVPWRSHLNDAERVTAIREGLIYGEFATNRFTNMKPNLHEYDSVANDLAYRILFNNREFGYGLHPLNDKFAWAARKALLICLKKKLRGLCKYCAAVNSEHCA